MWVTQIETDSISRKLCFTSAHHFLKRTKHRIPFLVPQNSLVKGELSFCSNGTAINRTVEFVFQLSATVMREVDLFTRTSAGNWLISAVKLQNYFSNGNKYTPLYFRSYIVVF